MNQYTGVMQASTAGVLYDANGNLTDDGERTSMYDVEKCLAQVESGPLSDKLIYDTGRRVCSMCAGNCCLVMPPLPARWSGHMYASYICPLSVFGDAEDFRRNL